MHCHVQACKLIVLHVISSKLQFTSTKFGRSAGIGHPENLGQMNNRSEIMRQTRMHSSRMRTARSLTIVGDGCLPGGGGSCDLSHHAFDVTCMLPLHQLSVSTSGAPYIV